MKKNSGDIRVNELNRMVKLLNGVIKENSAQGDFGKNPGLRSAITYLGLRKKVIRELQKQNFDFNDSKHTAGVA